MAKKTRIVAAAAVLTLPLTACGGGNEPQATTTTGQSTKPVSIPARPTPAAEPGAAGKDTCALFTTAEIAGRLGANVKKGFPTTIQQTTSCSWLAVVGGDGAVTIVLGPAAEYTAYKPDFTGIGKPSRQELSGVGEKAYVEGFNKGGWSRWVAAAVQGDTATVIDITGEDVKQPAATRLLKDALARG